jgi:hypothetical protein
MSFRAAFLGVVLGLAPLTLSPAGAGEAQSNGDKAGCDRFAWPVTREKAWFSGNPPAAHSGERLAMSDEALLLALKPTKTFHFFLRPERPPKADSYSGAIVIFGVATPGLDQITLSDEAFIDVFENGVRLQPSAFTADKDCREVRKSVRFELTPGAPVTIQISNAARDSIKVAIAPAT